MEIRGSSDNSLINRISDSNTNQVSHIKISSYGNYFATISENSKVVIWDGSSLEVLKRFSLETPKEEVLMLDFSSNETNLYLISESCFYAFRLNEKDKNKQLQRLAFAD